MELLAFSSTVLSTQGIGDNIIQGPGSKPSSLTNTLSKAIANPLNLDANFTVANSSVAAKVTTTSAEFANTTTLISDSSSLQTSYVSGSSAIQSCYTAWVEYYLNSISGNVGNDLFISAPTPILTTTDEVFVYSTFTLCDGWPRVDASSLNTWVSTNFLNATSEASGLATITGPTSLPQTIPTPAAILSTYYVASLQTLTTFDTEDPGEGTLFDNDVLLVSSVPFSGPDCFIAPTDCMLLDYSVFDAQFTTTGTQPNAKYVYPVCDAMINAISYDGDPDFGPCTISIPSVKLM